MKNKICKECKSLYFSRSKISKYCSRRCLGNSKILKTKVCKNCNKRKLRKYFRICKHGNWHGTQIRQFCKKCERIVAYIKTPEQYIKRLFTTTRLNSKYEIKFDLKYVQDLFIIQKGRCAFTNEKMTFISKQGRIPTNISIDRIDSTKGYISGNIHLVCQMVNRMKSDLTMEQFLYWNRKVYENIADPNNCTKFTISPNTFK